MDNKILIIDNKVDDIIALKAMLKTFLNDYQLITATSSSEGIAKAENIIPDVIVLYIYLSEIDGLKTCRLLKLSKKASSATILVITEPTTSKDEKNLYIKLGADAFVNKPFNFAELSSQLKILLRIKNLEKKLNIENQNSDKNISLIENIYKSIPSGIGIIVDDKITFANKYLLDLLQIEDSKLNISANNIFNNWLQLKENLSKETEACKALSTETIINDIQGQKHTTLLIYKLFDASSDSKFLFNIFDNSQPNNSRLLESILLNIHSYAVELKDNKSFLDKIHKLIQSILPVPNIYFGIYDTVSNSISIPYFKDEFDEEITLIPNSKNLISLVLKSKKPLKISKDQIIQLADSEIIEPMKTLAENWLGLPLINNANIIGVMVIKRYDKSHNFTEKQIQQLEIICNSIAPILELRLKAIDLEQALIKAQESEKLKNSFLSNISHEIRTPMNAIIGFSSLMKDELPALEREEYADIVINNGDMLMKILDDIVDVAKLESGEMTINKLDTNISKCLQNIEKTFIEKIQFCHKNIDLQLIIPSNSEMLLIKTDPFRLEQVLNNLLSNALKFTDKGKISFGFKYLNSDLLEFFVEDSGIGMSKLKLDKIFDRFAQVEEGHAREFGGIGLGLTISKNLVELLGGTIKVCTQVKKGTKFCFTIPLEKQKFIGDKKNKNRAVYDWRERKILIVDDLVTNLEFLELLIKRTNAEVVWATNGQIAVDKVKKDSKFDMILMDIQMPVMDGYTASRIIKNISPSTPIIAQTAFTEISDRKLAMESGCDDYLQKPINAVELLEKIDSFFN